MAKTTQRAIQHVTARHGTVPHARHGTVHGTAWHRMAPYSTVRHGTSPGSTTRHGTGRHGTARHNTAQHGTVRHGTATQYCTAQYCTARHGTAQHSTAQHGTARHSTVQHNSHAIQTCFWCFLCSDVFKKAIPLGRFAAVFLTFVASSLLHVSSWGPLFRCVFFLLFFNLDARAFSITKNCFRPKNILCFYVIVLISDSYLL